MIYEKSDDDTTIIEQSPDKSCVADRTRAKSSLSDPNSTVAFNLSNLMERIKKESDDMGESEEKEGDFELGTLPSLPLPVIKGSPTENRLLLESLAKMDDSQKTFAKIEQKEHSQKVDQKLMP